MSESNKPHGPNLCTKHNQTYWEYCCGCALEKPEAPEAEGVETQKVLPINFVDVLKGAEYAISAMLDKFNGHYVWSDCTVGRHLREVQLAISVLEDNAANQPPGNPKEKEGDAILTKSVITVSAASSNVPSVAAAAEDVAGEKK